MAKAKKKTNKPAKKKAAKLAAHRRAAPVRLDAATRASKLKPGDSLNELIAEVLTAWALVRRKVRVGDVTPAQLSSLARKAAKASQREADLAAKQAARIAPLTDARIVANDAAYRAALKVKRIADAVAASDQAVADAFADVTSRFRTASASADTGGASTPAT